MVIIQEGVFKFPGMFSFIRVKWEVGGNITPEGSKQLIYLLEGHKVLTLDEDTLKKFFKGLVK
jgi:hypothetical protein